MTDFKIEAIEATIAELKPGMKSVNITFKVMSTGEERTVESRSDSQKHRVLDARVGDSTGTIQMPFWNETIDTLKEGETYTLTNGYVGLFKGNIRLQSGKFGTIEKAGTPIVEINSTIDMSAEEHNRR
ncbi:MAG: single-stranded DNA-binding protein [Candidatus Thorarchaeota archaeon]|nr:single-stranded DNA-binding protein [Candidatus Thorarchaeota archaeon]